MLEKTEQNRTNSIAKSGENDLQKNFSTKFKTIPSKEIEVALNRLGDLIREITNPLRKLEVVQNAIEKNVDIHFGIRAGLMSDALIKSVIAEICKKFGSLSSNDIDFAFDNYAERKDTWTNVKKKDIIEPISRWWQKKELIRHEYQKFAMSERKKVDDVQKNKDFKLKSIELYREALHSGIWEGDLFNASVIAEKYVAPQIDQQIKNNVWAQAKLDYKEAGAIAEEEAKHKRGIELTPAMIGVSAVRIFSELIVKKGIELKIEI